MIRIETAKEMWDEYAKAAVPATAGPTQRTVMEQTFYAGLLSALVVVRKIPDYIDQAGGDDDVAIGMLNTLLEEVEARISGMLAAQAFQSMLKP